MAQFLEQRRAASTCAAMAGSVRSPLHGSIIMPIRSRPGSRPTSDRKLRSGAAVT
ncbi:hypothetical protein [Burkholderia plantarii]|uniref:hypothetical protein n=1 Tax=Burkholderia plantarii TaxID=41899 RepID=UPI001F5B7B22|nr:hypothetical protein [Burkholderia plantarii]